MTEKILLVSAISTLRKQLAKVFDIDVAHRLNNLYYCLYRLNLKEIDRRKPKGG